MRVRTHAAASLIAMSRDMPISAKAIIQRLEAMPEQTKSAAIVVSRMTMARGQRSSGGTNGDSLIVIVRDQTAVTAMLRRSWNQSFTPEILRVDEVIEWQWPQEGTAAA